MDAIEHFRSRDHAIPPWLDQEAHEGKGGVANEVLAIYSGNSVEPMFIIQISEVPVEPRRR